MKKIALKGMAAVLLVLTLCFFFSGTIRTLTTAKAVFIMPREGKLKEQITLTGLLNFTETEAITTALPQESVTYIIRKIHVARGSYVNAGDTLFEVEPVGLIAAIDSAHSAYQQAQADILALEKQYATLQMTRADQNWLNAYDALLLAKEESAAAHLMLDAQLPGASAEAAAQADYTAARAQAAMDQADRVGISDDAYHYTMQRRKLEEISAQAYQSLVSLYALQKNGGLMIADHAGYILDVLIAENESWNGAEPAIMVSAENANCFLRAHLPQNTRTIEEGTQVIINGPDAFQLKAPVTATGYSADGQPYADVAIAASDIGHLGTVYGLLNRGITLTISYAAPSTSILIPVSAVRGYGSNRFVYTVMKDHNAFGQTVYTIEQQSIDVLDETSEYVAVSRAANIGQIVYMEDRSIGNGSEVMPYD